VGLLLVLFSFTTFASAAWKEKVLYSFQGGNNDGAVPAGGVVFDAAGNLYGATAQGFGVCPPIECGSVFELSPPLKQGGRWTETVLHVFAGHSQEDGNTPDGGVIIDSSGNLYGTTAYGGTGDCILLGTAVGCGTVWELSPPRTKGGKWTYATLYSFPSPKEGYVPNGNLTLDSAGNLYGATMFGGNKGTTCNGFYGGQCGAVFELSPPKTKGGKWTEKVLHNFAGVARGQQSGDGANPNGGLIFDSKGALYGTAAFGGYQKGVCNPGGCGVTFELIPPNKKRQEWTQRILYSFHGKDAGGPAAGVVFGLDGNLYGTTFGGGVGGTGSVFKLAPASGDRLPWKETIVHAFNIETYQPAGGLVFDGSGNLYGTTESGDTFAGTVFQLKPPIGKGYNWTFDILHGFARSDGAQPAANLIFDRQGNLYSTTTQGGSGTGCSFHGCGIVFEVGP